MALWLVVVIGVVVIGDAGVVCDCLFCSLSYLWRSREMKMILISFLAFRLLFR